MSGSVRIDALQFRAPSAALFRELNASGLWAVHATIAYHGGFRDAVDGITEWNRRFHDHPELIAPGRTASDIEAAGRAGRTAIVLGAQNPSVIEDDLFLLEALYDLGLRFLQLTYNNQSLLGCGWQEAEDGGLTRMGRAVVREMNRLGLAIDLSHAGERTAIDAIEVSARPVAITHANPSSWRAGARQVSARVLDALAAHDGMLGLSLYPLHLRDGSATGLDAFCAMAARTADRIGVARLGIGSDLCLGQPDEALAWMREGRWMRAEGDRPRFPAQPAWFADSSGFDNLARGLREAGFAAGDVDRVLGGNWLDFMREAFRPAAGGAV